MRPGSVALLWCSPSTYVLSWTPITVMYEGGILEERGSGVGSEHPISAWRRGCVLVDCLMAEEVLRLVLSVEGQQGVQY